MMYITKLTAGPGLFQSWGAAKAIIYNINTTRRNGNATDILIDLKEQWYQLKKIKEEKINIFSNYYSGPFWPLKYEYNKIIKHMIRKHQINTYKSKIPRNNKIEVSNHYLRVTNTKAAKQNQSTYEKNQKYLEMNIQHYNKTKRNKTIRKKM